MDAPPNPNAATPPLQDVEDAIVEEFSIFDDPMDRYAYLIDLGKRLDAWPAERQTDDKLVPGCQSKVWLEAEALPDGRIRFEADSNTVITKGIIALLIRVLSGRPPQRSPRPSWASSTASTCAPTFPASAPTAWPAWCAP